MATSLRRSSTAVIEQLFAEPHRFDFFQAVRLLELAARLRRAEADSTASAAVGYDVAPRQEAVRFKGLASLAFPSGSIARLEAGRPQDDPEGAPPEMSIPFLGLTGPSGVLPQHYTSTVIERSHPRHGDHAMRDFFDLFHHRVISLYYRAWEKYRFPFAYERWRTQQPSPSQRDLFTACLLSLLGFGTDHQLERLEIDAEAFVFYGGHFAHAPRNAVALGQVLEDYFGVPVEVQQFCGQWLYLAESDQSALPSREHPDGQNAALGISTVIGSRVWDVEGKFRLRIGPLNYAQFQNLMPTGTQLLPLSQLVRTYVGVQFDFDVQAILQHDEVPYCQLGQSANTPARLGWNTWIHSGVPQNDAGDAVFRLPAV